MSVPWQNGARMFSTSTWSSPLRRTVLGVPRDKWGRFVNWASGVSSWPLSWHEPATEEELSTLVRGAVKQGKRVRVVGAGHSWSAIAAPDELAVSIDRCRGIIAVDTQREWVTVRAGTRLCHLNQALAQIGLSLPIVGSIAHQSVAGAIATGTHGSSLVHGNLASLVLGLRLIDGQGETVELCAGDPRLDGARVHLGSLGVVTQVTLRVQPAFHLAQTVESIPVKHVIGALPAIARSAEYVKVWWMPNAQSAQVFRYQRTNEKESRFPSRWTQRWFEEAILQAYVFPSVVYLEERVPSCIPPLNRFIARMFERPRQVGRGSLMLSTELPLRHRETEAALPMERSGEAFDRLVRLIDRERLRINFLAEVRFVRADSIWLSPAYGADTCQIGAYTTNVPDGDRYFAGFWREMNRLNARPHWGKEHDHRSEALCLLYPKWPSFQKLRMEFDPARTFSSPWVRQTLGD